MISVPELYSKIYSEQYCTIFGPNATISFKMQSILVEAFCFIEVLFSFFDERGLTEDTFFLRLIYNGYLTCNLKKMGTAYLRGEIFRNPAVLVCFAKLYVLKTQCVILYPGMVLPHATLSYGSHCPKTVLFSYDLTLV